jgi:hypothetical protein
MADIPLPGKQIPYHFTSDEVRAFLAIYSMRPEVSNYLWSKQPAYGVIVHPDPPAIGDFLVWFDATGVLHVVDITFLPLAREIEKPVYEAPDSSFVGNMVNQIMAIIDAADKLASSPTAWGMLEAALFLGGAFFLYQTFKAR